MTGNACEFTCHRPYKLPTKDDEAESGIWSRKKQYAAQMKRTVLFVHLDS